MCNQGTQSPAICEARENNITFLVRDCNGKRSNLIFANRSQVLDWAEKEMREDDAILLVFQGGACIYSGLQSDRLLTCDDITGFFA